MSPLLQADWNRVYQGTVTDSAWIWDVDIVFIMTYFALILILKCESNIFSSLLSFGAEPLYLASEESPPPTLLILL